MAQKEKRTSSGMQIPDEAIERLAGAMLPLMQQYFESAEGQLWLEKRKQSIEQKGAMPA